MMVQYFAGFWLAYMGMLGLCLSRERHFQALLGRVPEPSRVVLLQRGGWVASVLSLWPCWLAWQGPMGIVAWFGQLSLAGFILVMLLGLVPRFVLRLPAVAAVAWAVLAVAQPTHL